MIKSIVDDVVDITLKHLPEDERNTRKDEIFKVLLSRESENPNKNLDLSHVDDDVIIKHAVNYDLIDSIINELDSKEIRSIMQDNIDYLTDDDITIELESRGLDEDYIEENTLDNFTVKELKEELNLRLESSVVGDHSNVLYYILDLIRTQPRSVIQMDAEETILNLFNE